VIYWLNRRAERALEKVLRETCGHANMRVYRSADMTPRQYPCAVVRVMTCQRPTGAVYAGNRMMATVSVMTEFAKIVGPNANVIEEFEAIEEAAVSRVMEALFVDDLATQLNAQQVPGVTFSFAAIGDESGVTSRIAEQDTVSVVEIPLILRAESTEET
jgi:hypothetical protein